MVIPQRWANVLRQLQENGFPEAIIAGGALRDLDNDKPVKDIDVFVRIHKDDEPGLLSTKDRLEIAMGEPADKCVIDFSDGTSCKSVDPEEYYAFEEMSVVAVYDFKVDDETFQIIAMQTDALDFTKFVIDDFDIGFCQIWYTAAPIPSTQVDGKWFDYGVTVNYLRDKTLCRLTGVKCPDVNALERTKKRIARLLEKYPDFTAHNVVIKGDGMPS